ncbi:MAG: STAS/SEC14 domain-containing protein [Desulfobacterales bacterium]
MFQIMGDLSEKIVALKISGEITRNESEKITRIIDQSVLEHGSIRLLVVVEQYPSMSSAESLYEDLKFAHLYSNNIERMAVVGDRAFKNTWVALFGLFSGLTTHYFDVSQIKEAWNWIKEP